MRAPYLSVKSLLLVVGLLWKGSGSFKDPLDRCGRGLMRHAIEFQEKKKKPPDSEKPVYSQDAGRIPKSNVLDIQNTHSCSDSGESQVLGGGGATHACYTESDRPSWGSLRTESLGKSRPHSLSGRCCFGGSGHLRTSEHGPDLSLCLSSTPQLSERPVLLSALIYGAVRGGEDRARVRDYPLGM